MHSWIKSLLSNSKKNKCGNRKAVKCTHSFSYYLLRKVLQRKQVQGCEHPTNFLTCTVLNCRVRAPVHVVGNGFNLQFIPHFLSCFSTSLALWETVWCRHFKTASLSKPKNPSNPTTFLRIFARGHAHTRSEISWRCWPCEFLLQESLNKIFSLNCYTSPNYCSR